MLARLRCFSALGDGRRGRGAILDAEVGVEGRDSVVFPVISSSLSDPPLELLRWLFIVIGSARRRITLLRLLPFSGLGDFSTFSEL